MKYMRKTSYDIRGDYVFSLLKDREILSSEEQEIPSWYTNPTRDNLCDPLLLDNMEQGLNLFKNHLENNSHIRIYVDCDVDGFTSSAILVNYFNRFLAEKYPDVKISYRIPEEKEHGLRTVMEELTQDKICDLIILPDSSSNDYEEHKILKDMGYDILVLDHHESERYSDDAIVINNQLSTYYPNKAASGVGIVYKFLQMCDAMFGIADGAELFIDLVALGEISDMMNMQTQENRYICEIGLRQIENKLFREIIKKQCYSMFGIAAESWTDDYFYNNSVTQIKVAFYVTPLINALIRVGTQREKEMLFLGFIDGEQTIESNKRGSKGEFETVAEQVTRNCVNARSRQNREKEKAVELLDIQISDNCLDENKILILNADELDIPNTLTGLVAMGIAAKYKKPTMLGRISPDGYLKGSIRGREESELKDFKGFLNGTGYMDYVAGHPNSAGFSIKQSDVDRLYSYANEKLKDINFNVGYYEADFIVNGNYSDLTNLVLEIGGVEGVWGQHNKEPLIVVENIAIPKGTIQLIGAKKDTVKFSFNGMTYILFKGEEFIEKIKGIRDLQNVTITCVGRANLNKWGGRVTPQIYIDCADVKVGTIYDF